MEKGYTSYKNVDNTENKEEEGVDKNYLVCNDDLL